MRCKTCCSSNWENMLATVILLFLACSVSTYTYKPDWDSLDKRPLPSWYDKVKIGIFLHWGVFSVPSFNSAWFWERWASHEQDVEAFMKSNYRPSFQYPDFANEFTAEFFDPDQWAEIFNASGAKYVVLTSKHHEGYTLWPSKFSWNWNSVNHGPGRDLVGELATAIRKRPDMHFGVYHSLYEWFNPLYLNDKANHYNTSNFVQRKTMPELYELVTRYQPEVIWSDGDWEANDTYWQSTIFLAWLYNESPVKDTVVVNDRWGKGVTCKHGDFLTCNDRYNPKTLQAHKWENAMTLDKKAWGFRRNAQLSDFLTIEELITTLAETISCGGNLLINVGPTHDGKIAPIFEERLRQLGEWLRVNGEAVYESQPWTHQNDTLAPGIWYTSKTKSVYAIVLKWPVSNAIILGAIRPSEISKVFMLGYEKMLAYGTTSSGGTRVFLPYDFSPRDSSHQWAWVLKFSK